MIADRRAVLSGWYPKALKELSATEEIKMFGELVEAGKRVRLGRSTVALVGG